MLRRVLFVSAVLTGILGTSLTQAYIDKLVRKSATEYRHKIDQASIQKSILEKLPSARKSQSLLAL